MNLKTTASSKHCCAAKLTPNPHNHHLQRIHTCTLIPQTPRLPLFTKRYPQNQPEHREQQGGGVLIIVYFRFQGDFSTSFASAVRQVKQHVRNENIEPH